MQGKAGETIKMKHEKDLKPVSLRVRDAAELLLTALVEKVGNFPNPCGAHSLSCLLDEATLFRQSSLGKNYLKKDLPDKDYLSSIALKNFRYFATAEGAILSVLEEPMGSNDQGLWKMLKFYGIN